MKTLYYSYLITLLLFIGNNYCFGQAQNQEVTPYTALYPFEENGLYGLIDSVGRVVIEAQFSAIWGSDVHTLEISIKPLNEDLTYGWNERRERNRLIRESNSRALTKKRKQKILDVVPTSESKLLFLAKKNNAYYFLNEWAVVRIDGIYGYMNYKGEIRLNANDSSQKYIRNSSAKTFNYNSILAEEKIKSKIELIHPNKYVSLRPVINYPHLIIVYQDDKRGQHKAGLLKLDTLKNKTETIIPINKKSIEYDFRKGLIKVEDEQGTRLFSLSEETYQDIVAEKIKTKIERLHPNKYESLFPLIEYPHLIIVSRKINGTSKKGLLKLDTLKNKIETIIPINKKNIRDISNEWYDGILWVEDEQGSRLFDLSKETYQEEEKIKTKIEQLHPNKYESIRPLKNYPHLIIVSQKINGTNKEGLIKLDTLKNKTETIIPINKSSINNHAKAHLLRVNDEQGTRLFNLLEKTSFFIAEEKMKNKIERLHPNKYESLKPLKNDPHLIIASQKIKGTNKVGLIKFDTLKNKIETIIPFKKRFISNEFSYGLFHEGLLKVGDEQGIRLFNFTDETFLSPVFTKLGRGLNGYIAAQVNNKWGVLDSLGNWLYPPQLYQHPTFRKDLIYITSSEKKLCLQENGQFKFTNSDFEIMGKYGYQSNLSIFHLNGKYGIINTATRDVVLAPDYDDFYFDHDAHSGGVKFSIVNKIIKNNKKGLVNLEGKLVVPCIYTKINELWRYRKDERHFFSVKINNKQGIIDHEGNEILPPKYDEIKYVNSETYAFKKGKKWGYVYLKRGSPVNQKKIVSPKYTTIRGYENIIIYTTKREQKERILDQVSGAIIKDLEFTGLTSLNKTFILFRDAKQQYGIYNSQTKKVIVPPTYKYYKYVNTHFFALTKNRKWSIFNYRTGVISHKNKFDDIKQPYAPSRYGTCIPFKIDKKWGLMNAKGKIIFDAQATSCPVLNEQHLFDVFINGHFHQVDTTGKIVVATDFTYVSPFKNDGKKMVQFKTDSNLWGVADSNYQVIFPPQFESIRNNHRHIEVHKQEKSYWLKPDFTLGDTDSIPKFKPKPYPNFGYDSAYPMSDNPFITVIKNNKRGLIDTLGKEIIHPEYDYISVKYDTLAVVRKGKKYGVLNLQPNTLQHPIIFDKSVWVGKRLPCFALKPKKAYINYQGEFVWKEEYFDFNEVETVLKVQ